MNSSHSTFDCQCVVDVKNKRICSEFRKLENTCYKRSESVKFRHFGWLLWIPSSDTIGPPFKLYYVGPSEEIAKWGEFLNLVDRVLSQRDNKVICYDDTGCLMPEHRHRSMPDKIEPPHDCCAEGYSFNDLDRFKNIEFFGYSVFCRSLVRWLEQNCHCHIFFRLEILNFNIT